MSAAVYSRLLDEFRKGWVESGHTLFNLEIRSPGRFFRGLEPSESDTVNYEIEKVVTSTSLSYTAGGDGSTEAVVVVRKRSDQGQNEWPTQDLIDKFKLLCSEAGSALPLAIRNRLPEQAWMHRDPGKWWIALLATLHGFSAYDAEGRYQEKQFITNPWEASAGAIEYLGLNTDSPAWQESALSENGQPTKQHDDTASADMSAEGERGMVKKEFRDSHGLISVTIEGPDFDTPAPESSIKRKHDWPKIVDVSRELLRVLKQTSSTTPPKPAESRTDSLQFSAVNHQVGNLWTILYHLLTIDPRTDDCHCADDDATADMLWLSYQEHHELRSAALRLWRFFSRVITPRFNEFGRWPRYSDAELGEFEAAINALENAANIDGERAKWPAPVTVRAIGEQTQKLSEFIRDALPTTASKRPFAANATAGVIAELDRLTYLFYGRTLADYDTDQQLAAKLGWWTSLAQWIVATPGTHEHPDLNLYLKDELVLHANYRGWHNPIPAHLDAIFNIVAALRVYFGQIVFHRDHWIRSGTWLRHEIEARMVGLACRPDAQLGSWFNGELCRAPMYLLRGPHLATELREGPIPIPAEIERCGTFDAPKTEGVPAEWLDALEHYATKLLAAIVQSEVVRTATNTKEGRTGNMSKSDAKRAGEHFVQLLQTDPEFRAGLERASVKLRAFGEAIRLIGQSVKLPSLGSAITAVRDSLDTELRPVFAEYRAEIDRLWTEYRDVTRRIESEWETEFGAPYPKDVEDWLRWAARAGWSGERIAEGNWTPRDLFPIIEGYLLRLRDQKQLPHRSDRAHVRTDVALDEATIARGRAESKWLESHAITNTVMRGYLISAANRVQPNDADVLDGADEPAATADMLMLKSSSEKRPAINSDKSPTLVFHITPQSAFIEYEQIKHPVKHNVAEAYKKMYEAKGQPVGLTSILGDKPSRVLQKVPQELRAIVAKADGNKGYRLTISD